MLLACDVCDIDKLLSLVTDRYRCMCCFRNFKNLTTQYNPSSNSLLTSRILKGSIPQMRTGKWVIGVEKSCFTFIIVHSVQQKSSGLLFCTSRSGSDVTYSCHHKSSRFTFPIFVHLWRFSVFHSLQLITPRIY